MSGITIERYVDKVFGSCLKLSNAHIELAATLDFGPRIISLKLPGGENMLYNDADKKPLGEEFALYGGDRLRLYGGHRLWTSPELMPRCYHPDNLPVSVSESGCGIKLLAAVEKHNLIQKSITICLAEDKPEVRLSHGIENLDIWEKRLAPWSITMMAAGGLEVIPMPASKTGLLPNRSITLWDYSAMNDPRVYWGRDFIALRQIPGFEGAFKLGLFAEDGWALYFNKGAAFIKRFDCVPGIEYPDGGCSYETYTNGEFLELEALGGMVVVKPCESVTFDETWELWPSRTPRAHEDDIRCAIDEIYAHNMDK